MKLIIELKGEKMPLAYQMLGVSLIKTALFYQDDKYMQKLYYFDTEKSNKKPKDFCFSMRAYNYEMKGEYLEVKDKVVMCIATPNEELVIRLYNGLRKCKVFEYKDYEFNLTKVYIKPHSKIRKEMALFKTNAPIWIKDKEGQAVSIEDVTYNQELNYISNQALIAERGYGLRRQLIFTPVDMRKKVVKEEIRTFQENTSKPIFYLNCYEGIFKLEGDVEDLNKLYQLGLGFRRGQGFGMIELV